MPSVIAGSSPAVSAGVKSAATRMPGSSSRGAGTGTPRTRASTCVPTLRRSIARARMYSSSSTSHPAATASTTSRHATAAVRPSLGDRPAGRSEQGFVAQEQQVRIEDARLVLAGAQRDRVALRAIASAVARRAASSAASSRRGRPRGRGTSRGACGIDAARPRRRRARRRSPSPHPRREPLRFLDPARRRARGAPLSSTVVASSGSSNRRAASAWSSAIASPRTGPLGSHLDLVARTHAERRHRVQAARVGRGRHPS